MPNCRAIAKPMRGDDGSGVVGAVQAEKAGKAMRAASGTFTIDELRAFGDVDDQKRRELMLAISAKAGVKPEALGFTLPAEAKPVEAKPKAAHH